VVSTIGSAHADVAVEEIKTFAIEGVLLYLLVLNAVQTPEGLRRVLWVLLLGAAFLATVTIFQKVTGSYTSPYFGFGKIHASYFLGKSEVPRVSGPIGDPNYYAQILAAALPLGLVSIFGERSLLRSGAAIAASAIICVAIMLTFSRGAGLSLILLFGIMAFLRYFKPAQVLGVVLALVVLLATVPAYTDRIASVSGVGGATAAAGSQEEADLATRSRTTEMLSAALVFADHPVVGVGPGAFPHYYQEYAERVGIEVMETAFAGEREGEEAQRQAHNAFLSIAAELGLPGLVIFCALLWVTVRQLIKARRRVLTRDPAMAGMATGFMLAVIAYAANGMFLTLAFERYFWLLLGLAGAAASIALREPVDETAARPGS
jgi:putative inorganic carbon (hco3(-)) transporter